MKRVGNLWGRLISFPNLLTAGQRAAAGKRTRPDVAAFLLDLEWELLRLQRELKDGSYRPGAYRTFLVREAKPRLISAAPFRDRVVHHALTQVLEPIFERRFSKDSFACRKGFGVHLALARARWGAARHRFVLKCDVRKYFPSIDHEILKGLLWHAVKCRPTLDLAARIIDASNPQEEANWYFPGDDLFTPQERRRGLPLGNQTSQFFANVYLDPLDQMVTRVLKPDVYVRYVDDFLLFGDTKDRLHEMGARVEDELCRLRLAIHPRKSRVYRTAEGVTFLGWRIFPERSRLVRGNVVRFLRRLRLLQSKYAEGVMQWDDVGQRVRAWIAHAAHGDTWRLREQLLGQFAFRRRRAVASCGFCAGALGTTIRGTCALPTATATDPTTGTTTSGFVASGIRSAHASPSPELRRSRSPWERDLYFRTARLTPGSTSFPKRRTLTRPRPFGSPAAKTGRGKLSRTCGKHGLAGREKGERARAQLSVTEGWASREPPWRDDGLQRTADYLLPTAYCPLPTAACLLPTAYCLLPTAYCLLPSTSTTGPLRAGGSNNARNSPVTNPPTCAHQATPPPVADWIASIW